MHRSRYRATRLYRRLLRLYPASFRAEFSEEMEAVFAQAVNEAADGLALFGVVAGEVRDLPMSLLREYWWERRQRWLVVNEEGLVRRGYYSPRLFRFLALSLLALVGLYALSVAAAYFVFDLRVNSLDHPWLWWYTIAEAPGYIGHILPLGLAGLCFWMVAPPWIVLAGGWLTLMLWHRRREMTQRLRWLGVSAILAGAAMFATMGTPIGYAAVLWAYD